jgi:hypothetical protein
MSTVTGSITVGVEFRDGTAATGVQSVNVVSMRDAVELTGGVVAVVSGTVGAALISLPLRPTTYRNAAGNLVSINNVTTLALRGTAGVNALEAGPARISVRTTGTRAACGYASGTGATNIFLSANTGTAAYTCVMYGT